MAAGTAGGTVKERTLFGHPIGLSYLFTTEMWERFSYYGMRAILVYTLVNYLLLHPTADSIIGYHALKHVLEFVYNGGLPLAPQPLSSDIYGTYTSFVYLTPIIGGFIADRWLGQRNSVVIGAIIMAAGEFTLMVPQLFFLGLLLLIIGNGFFKPNISTQVGNLYKPGDHRIDSAFSIFYVGINLGAFFSPLVCGTLGEAYGYHWGYFAAGAGMVIGLISYLSRLRTLPQDRAARIKAHTDEKKPLTAEDWKATVALFLLFIPGSLFWAAYEQQGNTIALFAQDLTTAASFPASSIGRFRTLGSRPSIPASSCCSRRWSSAIWTWQAKRDKEPSVLTKMALGNIMLGLSYLVLTAACIRRPARTGAVGCGSLLFCRDHDGRALFLADRTGARSARVAPAANPIDDDGGVADHQFHRQPPARLYRQQFQPDVERTFLPVVSPPSAASPAPISGLCNTRSRTILE